MEYYSVLKRNELSGHKKMWRNLKCRLLSERSQSDSNYTRFWKRQNRGSQKISGCGRVEERETNSWSTGEF